MLTGGDGYDKIERDLGWATKQMGVSYREYLKDPGAYRRFYLVRERPKTPGQLFADQFRKRRDQRRQRIRNEHIVAYYRKKYGGV